MQLPKNSAAPASNAPQHRTALRVAALIVAGGSGSRMEKDTPKQYLDIAGNAILRHTAEHFCAHPAVTHTLIVIQPDHQDMYARAIKGLDLLPPAMAGSSRQASVCNGLEALAEYNPDYVLIHDAARPFVTPALITTMIERLQTDPALIAAAPITDTVKQVNTDTHSITATLDRATLWRAQTPQGFDFKTIISAHRAHAGEALHDDAAVMEAAGHTVAVVPSTDRNIKITTQADLHEAHSRLSPAAQWEFRTGTGFDVHAFDPNKPGPVILCGTPIDHPCSLSGHSDADAGLHALTDAILGTFGAGDIGQHFPPSDPQWKGADSVTFLQHALHLMAEAGGTLTHMDVTLIAEHPKIGPHRDAMRSRMADITGLERARISIKATTTEKLGFLGRGEGLAAQALVTCKFQQD